MNIKVAIVLGATGLTGRALLARLSADPRYDEVIALVRKPVEFGLPKVDTQVIDFDAMVRDPLAVAEELRALIDGGIVQAFCCLGTTIKAAGSQEAFRRVDFDDVVAFAEMVRALKAKHLGIVSAVGANASSRVFYSRVKGEMEDTVSEMRGKAFRVHFVRPSLLDGLRTDDRPSERIALKTTKFLKPLLIGPLRRYRAVSADAVAATLVRVAHETINRTPQHVRGLIVTPSENIF